MYRCFKRNLQGREIKIYKKGVFFKTANVLFEDANGKILVIAKKYPCSKGQYVIEIKGFKTDANYSRNAKRYSTIELPAQTDTSRKIQGNLQMIQDAISKKPELSFLWNVIKEVANLIKDNITQGDD
ncbi:MAG: hypothetical protein WC501_00355 [Candidatus Micrarchaeia archaeon]|jgi:hypothetical protein